MNNHFVWSEVDTGLSTVRRAGGSQALGFVVHTRAGAWFARLGLSGDLFGVESEADGKAKVEAALLKPVEVAAVRHGNVDDHARRNPNVAIGLHHSKERVFASMASQ